MLMSHRKAVEEILRRQGKHHKLSSQQLLNMMFAKAESRHEVLNSSARKANSAPTEYVNPTIVTIQDRTEDAYGVSQVTDQSDRVTYQFAGAKIIKPT